jgi:hypothetical protein
MSLPQKGLVFLEDLMWSGRLTNKGLVFANQCFPVLKEFTSKNSLLLALLIENGPDKRLVYFKPGHKERNVKRERPPVDDLVRQLKKCKLE